LELNKRNRNELELIEWNWPQPWISVCVSWWDSGTQPLSVN